MTSILWYILEYLLPYPLFVTFVATMFMSIGIYLKSLFYSPEMSVELTYKKSALADFVLKKCQKRIDSREEIPFYARNPHIQTILPHLMPQPYMEFTRKYLQVKDGGTVALDWAVSLGPKLSKISPILIVLPGIIGGADRCTFLCHRAMQKGFRCVVFNKRGYGNSPLTTPKLQSFGDPCDFRQAVKYIRSLYPAAKIVAVGTSVGAALLMSYLGEYGSSSYITAATCISPIYEAHNLFANDIPVFYEQVLLLKQKYIIGPYTKVLSDLVPMDEAFQASRMFDFEDKIYRQLYGYKSMEQYWERNCPMRDIDDVSTPLLCISSFDDPVIKKNSIPLELFKCCPNFMLLATERGGHGGFLYGKNLEPWADKVAVDYLIAALAFMKLYSQV